MRHLNAGDTKAPTVAPSPTPNIDLPNVDLGQLVGIACFSNEVTAQVQNKGSIAMKDLQVGDKILTSTGTFEPIYAFGHYHPEKTAEFIQLTTTTASVEISGNHLIYVANKHNPVRADSIKVGDCLRTDSGMGSAVTKIRTVRRKGAYAPLTEKGKLVVNDGLVVSSYLALQDVSATEYLQLQTGKYAALLSHHSYAHMGLSPFRLLCLGVSSKFCTSYNEEGISTYPALAIQVNLWAHQQHALVQLLVILALILLTGSCLVLETLFGAAYVPTMIVMIVGSIFWIVSRKNPGIESKTKNL